MSCSCLALAGCLVGLAGLVGWVGLVGWACGWLCCLVAWLVGCLVGCWVGWLGAGVGGTQTVCRCHTKCVSLARRVCVGGTQSVCWCVIVKEEMAGLLGNLKIEGSTMI